MKSISSAQNSIFSDLKKLLSSKGIHRQSRFLIWGEKFVNENLSQAEMLILSPDHSPQENAIVLSKELFKELDIFGTRSPILVCRLPAMGALNTAPKGLVLLAAASDPSNLGTIIRSSVSFGVEKIVLLKESASPFHPRSVRAAAGNVLKINYELGPSIENLNEAVLKQTFALDMKGEDIADFKWPKNCFLLLGEEGRGVPDHLQVKKLRIRTEAKVESLNAATAISIAMYSQYSSQAK